MLPKPVCKTCQHCGRTIKGRSDKKFCDDACRNGSHNQRKSIGYHYVRNINNILGKNRRILQGQLADREELVTVSKEVLLRAGFDFSFATHFSANESGSPCFFCYEYGYVAMAGNMYLVVKRKEGLC